MQQATPVDEEYLVEDNLIISQTDKDGNITYANRAFCTVSGYSRDELIGKPHSLLRHPDMPRGVFAKMWETIMGSQAWNGLIKNLRKNGEYYWVETEILPILNENEEITGYIAARRKASRKNINETQELYSRMLYAQE